MNRTTCLATRREVQARTIRQRSGPGNIMSVKPLDIRNRIVGHGEEDPASFVANPRNWRIHPREQADALGAVLEEIGWVQSVIVNKRSGFLVDGHLRVLESDRLGAKSIPVVYVDLSDEEEAKVIATLDPLAAMAATDSEKLKDLLSEIEAEQPALQAMLDDLAEKSGLGISASEDDDPGARIELADELQKKWKVKPGETWHIGRHRLLCGDSTDAAAVAAFAGEWRADSMVTDPPYGVNYADKNEMMNTRLRRGKGNLVQTPIRNDTEKDLRPLFAAFLKAAPLESKNTAYVFMHGQELHNLRLAFDDAGFSWGDYLVWVKNHHVLGRKDYNARHEFVVYGWKGRHKFYGSPASNTILEYNKPQRSPEHPTMKPVELVGRLLQDGSPIRGKVYDAFLGSGTTMVAAEQTGRACRGIEIEPRYCSVTLERLSEMGVKSERCSDGA